jgi:hypothetical protein
MAHEGLLSTAFSAASEAVKVDQTPPTAPTLAPDRSPDYADGGGWFKDSVTVTAAGTGDPLLADGSAGSGVDPASVPTPVTHAASGSFTDTATVKDNAGNTSPATSSSVLIDATAPSLNVSCPATALLNSTASATVTANDGQSGLALDPTGSVQINTATVGPKTVSRTATDNVGHATTATCTTSVLYRYSGVLQPVNPDGSSIFKLGSTIPVKFSLADTASVPVGSAVANLTVAKITNEIDGTYVEAVSTAAATTGTLFRYDASGQQYIFNLATNGLSKGTWNLKVSLNDGASYTTRISLR